MAVSPKELRIYESADGKRPFDEWLDRLKDKTTLARVAARLNRVELGNLGDVKAVGAGVCELRLAFGKGYREAKAYLQDYRRRDHGKKK